MTPESIPNLNKILHCTNVSIKCATHALSTPRNISLLSAYTPKDTHKVPDPINEFVYTEEILNELLHHLQAARKSLLLLGVTLGTEDQEEVSSNKSDL